MDEASSTPFSLLLQGDALRQVVQGLLHGFLFPLLLHLLCDADVHSLFDFLSFGQASEKATAIVNEKGRQDFLLRLWLHIVLRENFVLVVQIEKQNELKLLLRREYEESFGGGDHGLLSLGIILVVLKVLVDCKLVLLRQVFFIRRFHAGVHFTDIRLGHPVSTNSQTIQELEGAELVSFRRQQVAVADAGFVHGRLAVDDVPNFVVCYVG